MCQYCPPEFLFSRHATSSLTRIGETLKELIPALYLQRAAKKLPTAEERAKVMAVYQPMLERIRGPGAALSQLAAEDRAKLERVAGEAADLFQRSSSCVEGRNGQLALRHHSLHRLSKSKSVR